MFERRHESRMRSAFARATRLEGEGDHRGALRGYRDALREYHWLLDHGRLPAVLPTGVHVQVAATDGAYRMLRELHRRAPAEARPDLTAELTAAHTTALRTLLGRARVHREQGHLAEAHRDFGTVVEDSDGDLRGQAARELAEMIDDARGNRRHDRYPVTPYDRDQPRRVPTPAAGPDPRANLRALGYATEADARAAAIRLCRTALAHPTPLFERHGVSALLAQLLEDHGDAAGAAAAHAHREIPLLLDGALSAADHSHSHPRAQEFAPYVIARLHPTETIEHLCWSTLKLPRPPGSYRTGYLIRTSERLLFLEDFFYPHLRSDDGQPPDYEALAVERTHVRGTFSTNEHGVVRWHLRFGPRADGAMAHQGEVCVTLGKDAGPWRTPPPVSDA